MHPFKTVFKLKIKASPSEQGSLGLMISGCSPDT